MGGHLRFSTMVMLWQFGCPRGIEDLTSTFNSMGEDEENVGDGEESREGCTSSKGHYVNIQ